MNKVLSISVAAYNVETMIRKCLDSFTESGVIDDIEVIVTDDGSKDSTPSIVSEYADKYPGSIILVRQQNAGPGSTVNSGIAHATGKYFRMVDGDDWVNCEHFARLIERLKSTDADAVINNYVLVDNDSGETVRCPVENVEADKVLSFSEIAPKLSISMHNLIVKTDIMKEHVRLSDCFYTDMQYLVFPTAYLKSVVYLDLDVYMYRVSLGTQSMNPYSLQKNIKMHDSVLFSLIEYYENYAGSPDCDKNTAEYIIARIVGMAGCQLGIYLSFDPSKERKRELYGFLRRISERSEDVYSSFKQLKTVKVLNLSGLFYRPLSVMYRRKNLK